MNAPAFRLALAVALLAACGGSPAYWGAIPPPSLVELPHPPPAVVNGPFAFGNHASTSNAISGPALTLVDEVTRNTTPRDTGRGLEWRSIPGMSESFVWRVVLTGTAEQWADPRVWTGQRTPALSWRWRLEVKPKMLGDSAFLELASGTRETPEEDDASALGSGTLVVDWDALADTLGQSRWGRHTGRLETRFQVSPEGRKVDATVTVGDRKAGTRATTAYTGEIRQDGTGWMTVRTHHHPSPLDHAGSWTVEEGHWREDGAGRNEVRGGVGSPDFPFTVSGISSACWDASVRIVWQQSRNGDVVWENGDPGACVLTRAYAGLP